MYGLNMLNDIKMFKNYKGTSIISNIIQLKIESKVPISPENLFKILPEGV